MSINKSTRIPPMVGKAVFEVGDAKKDAKKTVSVEFDTIAELREIEDDLTWEHWPEELGVVSIDYRPAINHQAG